MVLPPTLRLVRKFFYYLGFCLDYQVAPSRNFVTISSRKQGGSTVGGYLRKKQHENGLPFCHFFYYLSVCHFRQLTNPELCKAVLSDVYNLILLSSLFKFKSPTLSAYWFTFYYPQLKNNK